jgi:hypothetical protein
MAHETNQLFCCGRMRRAATLDCSKHVDPFACPHVLVITDGATGEHALIIHDQATSAIGISFCPWCGTRLPGELAWND